MTEKPRRSPRPDVAALWKRLRTGDRTALAQSITLIESQLPADVVAAEELIRLALPHTGTAHRVGITGVPGVGKSTFIEALGVRLVEQGHRVAVLAVDPSSSVSGGSILGDKARMDRLAQLPGAYIRPSPSALTLGGVAMRTREAMLLCEAAGYDIVFVETVGVGQSETAVAELVDFFLVLMLSGAGDELQGIKRGILELADMIAVNKADGDNVPRAQAARAEYGAALRYRNSRWQKWEPSAVVVSALTGDGIDRLWARIVAHRTETAASGELDEHRREQRRHWLWSLIDERLQETFRNSRSVRSLLEEVETAVLEDRVSPSEGIRRLLEAFLADGGRS